ncbi:MAG: hypothetical protein AB1757_24325 [Acidobacteriota bacterium]
MANIVSGAFNVIPQYVGNDTPPNQYAETPYLVPPNLTYSKSVFTQPIQLNLYSMYTKSIQQNTCGISQNANNVDFSLSWNVALSQQMPTPVAVVTIQPKNVWGTSAQARAQLRKSFDAFRVQLEALELAQGCLRSGGAYAIAQAVAESMPLSLAETLYYRYGFDAQNGYVDLLPGMRLRVESAINQTMSTLAPVSSLNGFVPGNVAYYQVARLTDTSGNQRIAFDAFLGSNRPPTIPVSTGGIGGIIDLQQSNAARRYYRLFYPPQLAPGNRPDNAALYDNVTLIGADTLSDLYAATAAYLQGQTCATVAKGNLPIICSYFRGRAIAVPEIGVCVNTPFGAQSLSVPVGTTARNLFDLSGCSNFPLVVEDLPTSYPTYQYFRTFGLAAPFKSPQDAPFRGAPPVNFALLTYGSGGNNPTFQYSGQDVYDLPVAKGDLLNLYFQS